MMIREHGRRALKPCDMCSRTKTECMVANDRSEKCSKCIERAAPGCNAIPCMFLSNWGFLSFDADSFVVERMTSELRRLQQELQEAVRTSGSTQQVADEARMIANDKQVEASASWAATLLLQEQYSLLESTFNMRLDEEVASLEMSVGMNELDPVALGSDAVFQIDWLLE